MRTEKGVSNLMVRVTNRKNIMKLLYNKGSLTKHEIATLLDLSLPTVTLNVQQLKANNLITEQSSDISSGGRKPQLLCFNYDARVSVGLEISQNHNRLVLINLKNKLIDERHIRVPFTNTKVYWEGVSERVRNIISENNIIEDRVLGIGVAAPGTVKHDEGIIEFAPTLSLRNFHYEKLKEFFDIPVLVENEANAAGFAEVWNRKVIQDAVYISITKGVGGAVIVNNKLFFGKNNRCGEFGHMTLIPGGANCSCGRKGCFEAYCSTKVLTNYSNGDIDAFFTEKEKGNKEINEVWDKYLDHLAIGISNIKMAFDTEIIVGGDLDLYLRADYSRLHEKVKARFIYEDSKPLFIVSNIGKNASAIGSALLLVSDFLKM